MSDILKLFQMSESEYNTYLQNKCMKSKYYHYQQPYFQNMVKFLYTLCVNVSNSHCTNLGPFPLPLGYVGIELTSTIHGTEDVFGYFLYNATLNTAIIVFAGTFYQYQWFLDADMKLVDVPFVFTTLQAHEGFLMMYTSLRKQLNGLVDKYEIDKLYISGVSLGAGLSVLAGLDFAELKPTVVLFAGPRVLDIAGAKVFDMLVPKCLRVYNTEDVITALPPAILDMNDSKSGVKQCYMHVGEGFSFTDNLCDVFRNHTDAYKIFFDL